MAGDSGWTRRARARTRNAAGALLALLHGAAAGAAPEAPPDLTAVPFEQLLALEVYSASRFVQKASEAPSAVSVIGADEIRAFGWRTLADVLRSVRGLYLSYDRNYTYLGARSFLRPGDYNTRFLLQIDGLRVNDPLYDQAPVGAEFPLDLELIERIEYAPGAGSSIYGANAFFGVINVITKRAREFDGAHARLAAGQADARRGAASYGWRDAQGNELLLSASRSGSAGRDLYFAEFDAPGQSDGVAHGLDHEHTRRFFAKGAAGPFSLSLLHAERAKGMPTASFGQAFDDPRARTRDAQTYLDLGYHGALAGGAALSGRLYWGHYDSAGDYVNDVPERSIDHDGGDARWYGFDLNVVGALAPGHKLLAGVEYQRDARLLQYSYDIAPRVDYLYDARRSQRAGLYLQDELGLRDNLLLNAGLRYDKKARGSGMLNPRLALIWQAAPATTLKALYGTAYREPNSYELYYAFPGPDGQRANPALRQERIRSRELVLLHQFGPDRRLTVTAFRNDVSDLIAQSVDGDGVARFDNGASVRAHGVEAEYERRWDRLAALRMSYSWQNARQDGAGVVNAPASLAKLNLGGALPWQPVWRAGLEAQYVGARATLRGRTGGFWLANLNLFSTRLTRRLDAALGLYNLFGKRYADPAPAAHAQDTITQDGRTLRLTLDYAL